MKINFKLAWISARKPLARFFKSPAGYELFTDYTKRISHFCRTETLPLSSKKEGIVWLCDRARGKKPFSSEELAAKLKNLLDQGCKTLEIVIGGAEGTTDSDLKQLQPDEVWSFGPLTLPHEMAAVVAAEQIYRAWTILKGHPYHSGHR